MSAASVSLPLYELMSQKFATDNNFNYANEARETTVCVEFIICIVFQLKTQKVTVLFYEIYMHQTIQIYLFYNNTRISLSVIFCHEKRLIYGNNKLYCIMYRILILNRVKSGHT